MDNIIKELDALIKQLESGEISPTPEILVLIEDLSDEIEVIQSKKSVEDKSKYNEVLFAKLDKLMKVTSDNKETSSEVVKNIVSAVEKIKIEAPKVNVSPPKVEVTVPETKMPKMPKIEVNPTPLTVPNEFKLKKPNWLAGLFNLKAIIGKLSEISKKIIPFKLPLFADEAVPVRLSDGEKFYRALGGSSGAASIPTYKNSQGEVKQGLVDDQGHVQTDIKSSALPSGASTSAKQLLNDHDVTVSNMIPAVETGLATSAIQNSQTTLLQGIGGFILTGYDYIALTYVAAGNGVGEIETAIFKTGGSGGTTIATLTLAYNVDDEISSVTKT